MLSKNRILLGSAFGAVAVERVLPYVPSDLRVPYRAIYDRLPREIQTTLGHSKPLRFFQAHPQVFEVTTHPSFLSTDKLDACVRRLEASPCGDAETAQYPEYSVGPTTVLSLAYIVPSNFVPVESLVRHAMANIPALRDTKWPVHVLCGMYPNLMELQSYACESRVRSKVSLFESTSKAGVSSSEIDDALRAMVGLVESAGERGVLIKDMSTALSTKQREALKKLYASLSAAVFEHKLYFAINQKANYVVTMTKPRPAPIVCTFYDGPRMSLVQKWLMASPEEHMEWASAPPAGFEDGSTFVPERHFNLMNNMGATYYSPMKKSSSETDIGSMETVKSLAKTLSERLPEDTSKWVRVHDFTKDSITPEEMKVICAHRKFPVLFLREFPEYFEIQDVVDQPGKVEVRRVLPVTNQEPPEERGKPSLDESIMLETVLAILDQKDAAMVEEWAILRDLSGAARAVMKGHFGGVSQFVKDRPNNFQAIQIGGVLYVQRKSWTKKVS